MARSDAVWGIDIGQCALKALRCRPHNDNHKILIDAFDYIEYPKILSQAGAEPAELIAGALKQFLSRNTVRGDRVAISVSGQSGLARFIKLPPVEAKKIPDIVRYEARQQIPFDLNDVIWDYQRMGGGAEEEGFALETEIGLFAMKRDAVFRTLEPFQKAGIEIDFVQLTPLALYNFVLFDQLNDLPPADEYDPENPPPSVVILSLGTDATDLVVTNGFRVWQRSIPLGGNHFTKALTKELKLTFAKAEHLKRHASGSDDPKAIFQAMRPVFSDLLTELQRSIGYFTSIDRAAKISHIVALGNATKLPGLRRYLAQSLGFEVIRLEEFRGLAGTDVLAAPAFKENALSFAVCYGLALQGLGKSGLSTNLLPKEILKDRLIRQKKPWAVAAAAALLLACTISFASFSRALGTVSGSDWDTAAGKADQVQMTASGLQSDYEAAEDEYDKQEKTLQHLVRNVENRVLWLELFKVLANSLPHDPPGQRPKQIELRNELHVTSIDCVRSKDLAEWYKNVKDYYHAPEEPIEEEEGEEGGAPEAPDAAAAPVAPAANPVSGQEAEDPGPSGEGWVVGLFGHHYHNASSPVGADFVEQTLIKNLRSAAVELPNARRDGTQTVNAKELGIGYPVLVDPPLINKKYEIQVPDPEQPDNTILVTMPRFDFQVQFCWQETTPGQREEQARTQDDKGGQPAGIPE